MWQVRLNALALMVIAVGAAAWADVEREQVTVLDCRPGRFVIHFQSAGDDGKGDGAQQLLDSARSLLEQLKDGAVA